MRTFLTFLATVLFITSTLRANSWSPTPDQRWELTAEKPTTILGDDAKILLSVVNTGKEPLELENLGCGWDRRDIRFELSAQGPGNTDVPQPQFMSYAYQGMGFPVRIAPGDRWSTPLDLAAYCWIDQPGTYKIHLQSCKNFLVAFDSSSAPPLECTVTFVNPTKAEAKQLFDRACEETDLYCALRPMHGAIYVPFLLSLQDKSPSPNYVRALSESYHRETTQALMAMTDGQSDDVCCEAMTALICRIPATATDGISAAPRPEWLAEAWQSDLTPAAQATAIKALSSNAVNVATFASEILDALGPPDAPQIIVDRLDKLIRAEAAPNVQPPNRYAIDSLLKACTTLIRGGHRPQEHPTTPGEIAFYLQAIKEIPTSRPANWQTFLLHCSSSEWPTIRELSLHDQPSTLSDAMRARLPALVTDPDARVADAACDWVIQEKDSAAAPQVLTLLANTDDISLLKKAFAAAVAAGVRADALRVIVNQLPETAHSDELMLLLCDVVDHGGGSRFRSSLSLQAMADMQKVWHPWLQKHRDELNAGKVFTAGDPDLPLELFPTVFQVHLKNGVFWPADR